MDRVVITQNLRERLRIIVYFILLGRHANSAITDAMVLFMFMICSLLSALWFRVMVRAVSRALNRPIIDYFYRCRSNSNKLRQVCVKPIQGFTEASKFLHD